MIDTDDLEKASYRAARIVLIVALAVIAGLCLLAFAAGRLLADEPSPLGAEWWEVLAWEAHDLDTWSNSTIRIPHIGQQIVRRDIRLHGADACEVTYARQAVLNRSKSVIITPAEIARGTEGLEKLEAAAQGGRRFIRIVKYEADYNRTEADMRIVTSKGESIDVAEWIRANGYERPTKSK